MNKESKNFGGNIVNDVTFSSTRTVLAKDVYNYDIYKLQKSESIILNSNLSQVIYFFSREILSAEASIGEEKIEVNEQGALMVENETCSITSHSDELFLFAAGTNLSYSENKIFSFINNENIKKVQKPWGYEMWINGEHPLYALKRIYIKQGNKTSLQYHEFKRETNFLFEGIAKLHYDTTATSDPGDADLSRIENTEVGNYTSIDVWPKKIHRIEAVTDILLFEVSTPHLDDVVRLSDDSKRENGRIADEHK